MNIAVLVPVYSESAKVLQRSISSILRQRMGSVHIFVIATGNHQSKDARDYLRNLAIKVPNLHLSVRKKRLSAAEARNALIDLVRKHTKEFQALAFLDADDEWLPNHLEQYLASIGDRSTSSSVYSAPYVQRASNRSVIPKGEGVSIWSLTRQPLLLSSIVITHIPIGLRFRGSAGGEDMIFFADCLNQVDFFISGQSESVIYSQCNWKKKKITFKIKRTYTCFLEIFGSRLLAVFFLVLFSVHYICRSYFPNYKVLRR